MILVGDGRSHQGQSERALLAQEFGERIEHHIKQWITGGLGKTFMKTNIQFRQLGKISYGFR